MSMRVTQETFYRQTIYNIMRRKDELARLNQEISSGKRINTPSDDPVGAIATHLSHRMLDEITQYKANLDHAKDWLQQGESSLRRMSDVFSMIKERAEQMATGTYTPEQRQMIAKDARNFFDQLVALANSKVAGENIFSGTRVSSPAVRPVMEANNPAELVGTHSTQGRLYGLGTYTGRLSRNVSLTVDAGYAGGKPSSSNPMTVNYSYTDDFGRTISGSVTLTGTGTGYAVDVGNGVSIYADDQDFTAGEQYTLKIGRYRGNEEDLEVNLSWSNRMRYNYTLEEFLGAEGYSGGEWASALDKIEDWIYALERDSKTRDYFEAVPGTTNHPASTQFLNVEGDWGRLNYRDLNFYVGGPLQSSSSNEDIGFYRNFTVDAAYAGGEPSTSNPMTVNYQYWTGAAWANASVSFTGTGSSNSQTINDAAGHSVDLYLVDAAFTAGQALPSPGSPIQSSASAEQLSYYRNFTVTTAGTPAGTVISYEYWNESTGSWSGPVSTPAFAGPGSANAVTLQNVPSAGTVQIYLSDVGFDLGNTWSKLPVKIGSDVTPRPGPPPLAVDFTYTYQGDSGSRLYGTEQFDDTGSDATVDITAGSDTFQVYVPEDGSLADNDTWSLTLEQYNQAQTKSQELLPELETLMSNLLTYVADAGSRLNRLDVRDKLLDDDTLRLYDRLEANEDTDMTEAMVDLSTQDVMYQATLQATTLLSGRNLSDYL